MKGKERDLKVYRIFPFSSGAGFKHCLYLYRKPWQEEKWLWTSWSVTQVTNYSSLLFFSERDNWERHVSDFCFPRYRGEQAGSPPWSQFLGFRKIWWALTVLAATLHPPPPQTSQRVSLLGSWVSNSATFRTGARSWVHRGTQQSSTSGLG